jgi:hypothetical protein
VGERTDMEHYLINWRDEFGSAAPYHKVAGAEDQESLAEVYCGLAETEGRHARFRDQPHGGVRCHSPTRIFELLENARARLLTTVTA